MIFEEPYSIPVRYWIADIFEGDIYEIDKEVFDAINDDDEKIKEVLAKIGAI